MTQTYNAGIQAVTHTETHTHTHVAGARHAIKYMQSHQHVRRRNAAFRKKKRKRNHNKPEVVETLWAALEAVQLLHNHEGVTQPELLIFQRRRVLKRLSGKKKDLLSSLMSPAHESVTQNIGKCGTAAERNYRWDGCCKRLTAQCWDFYGASAGIF